jgi:hypothetical protein
MKEISVHDNNVSFGKRLCIVIDLLARSDLNNNRELEHSFGMQKHCVALDKIQPTD